ncbi:MAG: pilus assembly protein PilP [Pseudomonadota bacterium]
MIKNLILLMAVSTVLSGCLINKKNDMSDIDQIMSDIDESVTANLVVEEPVTYQPYEPFNYTGSNKRSPFKQPLSVEEALRALASQSIAPDESRQKEYLEQFDVADLTFVGTMSKSNKAWALVKDPESKIHRVTKGNYLGQNYGRIKSIGEDSIVLLEVIPNGVNGWLQRPFNLSLQGK